MDNKGKTTPAAAALLAKAKTLFPLNVYDYRDTIGYLHFSCDLTHLQIVDFLKSQGLPFGQGDVWRCVKKIEKEMDQQDINKAIELADRVMAQREKQGA